MTYVGLSFGFKEQVSCGIFVEVLFKEEILSFTIFNLLHYQCGLHVHSHIPIFFKLFRSFLLWRFPYVSNSSLSTVTCFLNTFKSIS